MQLRVINKNGQQVLYAQLPLSHQFGGRVLAARPAKLLLSKQHYKALSAGVYLGCVYAVQFEVVSKEDQQTRPAPLPLLHQFGNRVRPPRPTPVQLSVQPYNATRQSRRQSQGDNANDTSAPAALGGYQNLALLPVSEPCGMDAGHLYDAFPGEWKLPLYVMS